MRIVKYDIGRNITIPDFNDDDAFMSGDSIPMGRNPSMARHLRLSTVNRSVLASIPEREGNMTLTVPHQKMGSKTFSRSEPIARKNSDGSIFINSNLPRRLQPQDESEGALNSLPQRRNRTIGNELSMEPEVSDEMRCLASVGKIGTVSMVE
jgi:hypothetical protein